MGYVEGGGRVKLQRALFLGVLLLGAAAWCVALWPHPRRPLGNANKLRGVCGVMVECQHTHPGDEGVWCYLTKDELEMMGTVGED